VFEPLFAHRAFCARLIFLRAAADRVRRFRAGLLPVRLPRAANAAPKRFTSPCASVCAFFNCWTTPDRFAMKFPLGRELYRTIGGPTLLDLAGSKKKCRQDSRCAGGGPCGPWIDEFYYSSAPYRLTTTLDKFLRRLTDIEEEFIFMKEDLKRVKAMIRQTGRRFRLEIPSLKHKNRQPMVFFVFLKAHCFFPKLFHQT